MKYIWILLLAAVFAFSAIGQETINVDVTKLTQQELALYQKLKREAQSGINLDNFSPEKIDKYAQIGKAFGTAFRECWTTVSTDAERFAQSPAGKWAMVLVSWKIMGQDAVGLTNTVMRWVVGTGLLFVGIPFWIWIIRRNCVVPPVGSVEKSGFWTKKVTYRQSSDPIHSQETGLYLGGLFIYIALVGLLMFVR